MKLSGSHTFSAPRQRVWEFFNDPARLAKVLPGAGPLESIGPDKYKAQIKFALAAFTGTYGGTLELAEKRPPESLRLRVEGKGGPGFMKGEGRLTFGEAGENTTVTYEGDAQVGGLIAAVGSRMIEAAAKKILQQFFEGVDQELRR